MSAEQARVAIVGAGLAGFQVASGLAQQGHAGSVTLIGDEPGLPYDRPPLSKQFQVDGNEPALQLAAPEANIRALVQQALAA